MNLRNVYEEMFDIFFVLSASIFINTRSILSVEYTLEKL